ncbi:Peptidase M24 [Desulfovibrionales bacterium]
MLLKKYCFVIFKDNDSIYQKLYFRGWVAFIFILIVGILVAANVYYFKLWREHVHAQDSLGEAARTVEEQRSQLLSLATKLKSLEDDLARIRDFDIKLRTMINLEDTLETVSTSGKTKGMDFTKSYLSIYRQELIARNMHNFIDSLGSDARLEEVRQQDLSQAFQANPVLFGSVPSIWPTDGWVSLPFGQRTASYIGKPEQHLGIDISGKIGTPVYAPARGVVALIGEDGIMGKTLVLRHGNGIVTRFSHLHDFQVKEGKQVERGEIIATMGNSGRSTGPHLHYEVRVNGTPINPMRYILN